MPRKVWDEITYPFLNFDGLGMGEKFHPILYNGCDYISILGLQLFHVSKRGPKRRIILSSLHSQYHGCCCPGDARSQGISNHNIYYVESD